MAQLTRNDGMSKTLEFKSPKYLDMPVLQIIFKQS